MSKTESAHLLLKLYDLRREKVMRDARTWVMGFMPESQEELMGTFMDENNSAYLRMVISYWDNAATLVNHGAIDEEMFNDMNGEHIYVFSKIYPFLSDMREAFGRDDFLANLEKLIMRMPDSEKVIADARESMKKWADTKKEMSKGA